MMKFKIATLYLRLEHKTGNFNNKTKLKILVSTVNPLKNLTYLATSFSKFL